jgi:predicted alpha/beta-fold hydrolase
MPTPMDLTAGPLEGEGQSLRSSPDQVRGDWFRPFEPLPWLRGGHAQTLAGNFWRRPSSTIPSETTPVEVDPANGSRVLCHCHWQPEAVRADRLTILLVHGLEGSSDSRYMLGIASEAWTAGCNVVRMNMRNCGGTDNWTPTLYHCGFSGDVEAVLRHLVNLHGLQCVAMAGYSMGGNLVLKLAGEFGDQAPKWLQAAVGVSPSVDLAATADALHDPSNRMYERHFLGNLMRRFRRKVELFPEIYSMASLGPIRTIREFDEKITARYSGFRGADDYYFRAASARVVRHIAIPTLVLHAKDDPFIRLLPESRADLAANPAIELIETAHGGHCAFLARKTKLEGERHWAESTLVRYLMAVAGHAHGG